MTFAKRLSETALATGHTFILATLLPLTITAQSVRNFPADRGFISTLIAVSLGTAAALLAARMFGGSLHARATWLSAAVIAMSGYSTVLSLVRPDDAPLIAQVPMVAGGYMLAALSAAMIVRSPWDRTTRHTPAMSMLAVVLLARVIIPLGWTLVRTTDKHWRPAADALVEAAAGGPLLEVRPQRDVYFILLDGFGRQDTLNELYGVDLREFTTFLAAHDFYVPSRSLAPYAQTVLSLSASLNMTYLDPVADTLGRDNPDRHAPAYMLQHNALMRTARRAGYRVLSTGSEFPATSRFASVDEVTTEPTGLTEIQQAAIEMTPLGALPLERWTREAHGRNVRNQFAALTSARAPSAQPTFVFAHVLTPHPPFVFDAGGGWQPSQLNWFTFADGDHFRGTQSEYRAGYRAQVQFVVQQLRDAVSLLLNRPGPSPVIVITGDHGPGSALQWEDPSATDLHERMAIFAAYRFPGTSAGELYDSISPVNAARLLANHYFGTQLPALPDRSLFSTWSRPYDFVPFTE